LLFRVLFAPRYRVCWVSAFPPLPRRFRRTAVVFPRYRPPSSVKKTGSSSRKLHPPSEFVLPSPARCVAAPSAFLGVFALLAVSVPGVHFTAGVPAHLCSALSVSHTLDGFLLHEPCRLISSRCHVQGFTSGVSSHEPAVSALTAPFPLAVGVMSLLMLPPAPVHHASTSGSCSGPRSATAKEGLAPLTIRIPSCVLLLRALLRKP